MNTKTKYGITIIRLGMSGVLLWFGAHQVMDFASWAGYVPDWAIALTGLSAETIALANGCVEIACGVLLFLGVFTRPVAFVMALHLAIIALEFGNSETGVRDWGLAAAFLGLLFTGAGALSIDGKGERRVV